MPTTASGEGRVLYRFVKKTRAATRPVGRDLGRKYCTGEVKSDPARKRNDTNSLVGLGNLVFQDGMIFGSQPELPVSAIGASCRDGSTSPANPKDPVGLLTRGGLLDEGKLKEAIADFKDAEV